MRRTILTLALVMALAGSATAQGPGDVTLIVTRSHLQRLLSALCPVTFAYALTKGLPVQLAVTLGHPVVRFHPGRGSEPGHMSLGLDYLINSVPPLIKGLTGRMSPRLSVAYDRAAATLVLRLENLKVDLGGAGRLSLAQLVPPLSVPLGQLPPVVVGNRRVQVTVRNLMVRVTRRALIIRAWLDYRGGFARVGPGPDAAVISARNR
ncbi:MAG: hypothetical protein KJ621_09070 [Proteobacteria bacterium]|nr:hypothetical protein [Pseudomonadota bacterium]